jgi:hypothetical protein
MEIIWDIVESDLQNLIIALRDEVPPDYEDEIERS